MLWSALVDNSCLSYTRRNGVSSRQETAALASVYAFVLKCHAKKKAGAAQNTGHDEKRSDDDLSNHEYT